LRYNFAGDSFYIMKPCNRLLVLYCLNCPKDDKFRYLIPILRKLGQRRTLVDGSLESRCRLLITCNGTSFSISYSWLATRQNMPKLTACWRGWVSLSQHFRGKGSSPLEYFLVSRKLDTFCYLTVQSAPCYVQSF